MELREALAVLDRPAEEVFGSDPAEARRRYHRLARVLHPDAGTDGRAFTRLSRLWRTYQGHDTLTITTRKRVYGLGSRLARGDLADLFQVSYDASFGVLKLPRDQADSDLLEREAVALRQLPKDGEKRFLAYVPELVETLRYGGRSGNVLRRLDGFVPLTEVRSAYPGGVDPRDVAWMWRRLLVGLGFAHKAGVLHGAVLPEHVLIHPDLHGLVLVDWCYSVPGCYAHIDGSGKVPAMVTRRSSWYPPEVPAKQTASAATDLFMATRCMTYLMGPLIPRELQAFARGCMLTAQNRRPSDAWKLLAELDELLGRLYGPRTFRPFHL